MMEFIDLPAFDLTLRRAGAKSLPGYQEQPSLPAR
jgi:hypothetical protein